MNAAFGQPDWHSMPLVLVILYLFAPSRRRTADINPWLRERLFAFLGYFSVVSCARRPSRLPAMKPIFLPALKLCS
jgi:hypothetical protein